MQTSARKLTRTQRFQKMKNSKKRNGVKRYRNDQVQDYNQVGRGNNFLQVQRRGLFGPDQYTTTFKYAEEQRNLFNTAISFGSMAWRMTDLLQFRTSVAPTIINGLTTSAGVLSGDPTRYRRYRVNKVHFTIRLQNREAVNPITVVLHPSQNSPAVASAAEFQWLMEQRSNVVRTLGPATSGSSVQTLKMSYNPEKLVGEQFHEQDEYSGALTVSTILSPTTPLYMGLSFHNVNVNTVTTGGLVITTSVALEVIFYEPDRDEDPATFKTLDKQIEDLQTNLLNLKLRQRDLTRENSK